MYCLGCCYTWEATTKILGLAYTDYEDTNKNWFEFSA